MILSHTRRIGVVLLAVAALAACAGAPVRAERTSVGPAATGAGAPAASARPRSDSVSSLVTAADVHFMSGMIGHHAQAIEMARLAPTHGASPQVRTLAERIINAQKDEIATMQQWLRDCGQPVPEARPGPMRMTMNGVEHEMLMPGMLTPEQMKRLDQARGTDFDRVFLTFMIQHHRGAVSMVQELFGTYGAAQDEAVFKLASDVNVDQTTEIARMESMLEAIMFGTGPS